MDLATNLAPATKPKTMRRSTIARRLGVSVSTVVALEAKGHLHPIRGADGWSVLFEVGEVEALAAKYKKQKGGRPSDRTPQVGGRAAAAVFELLQQGATFAQIVIATALEPSRVRAIANEWRLGFDGLERERAQQRARAETRRQQREYERQCAKQDALDRTLATRVKIARIVASGTAPVIVEGAPDPKLAGAALAISIAEMSRATVGP